MKAPTDDMLFELDELVKDLLVAKAREDSIRKERIEVEEQIARLVETKPKGQATIDLPSGFKLTVKRGINYKADVDAIRQLCVSPEFPPPIKSKTTHELDEAGYEWYHANRPELFRQLAQHVEMRPKKVAVTIKKP